MISFISIEIKVPKIYLIRFRYHLLTRLSLRHSLRQGILGYILKKYRGTPDYISPATAAILQHKLGIFNGGTFDINSACASWIAGVDVFARDKVSVWLSRTDGSYHILSDPMSPILRHAPHLVNLPMSHCVSFKKQNNVQIKI